MIISFAKTPFSKVAIQDVEFTHLQELAEHLDCDMDKSEIYVDGIRVSQAQWKNVSPPEDSHITVIQVPGELATLVTAATILGIGEITRKLIPDVPEGPGQSERLNRIDGARNSASLYGPVPVFLGRHKIAPPYAARLFKEYQGLDEYITALFCVGEGPLKLHTDTLKIGETLASSYSEVEVRYLDHFENTDVSQLRELWPGDVVEETVGVELAPDSSPGNPGIPTVRTSNSEADIINLNWSWPQGVVELSGSKGARQWSSAVEASFMRNGDKYVVARYGTSGYYGSNGIQKRGSTFLYGTDRGFYSPKRSSRQGRGTNVTANVVADYPEYNTVVLINPPGFVASRYVWASSNDEVRRGLSFRNPFPGEALDIECRQIYGIEKPGTSREHFGAIQWDQLQTIRNLTTTGFDELIGGRKVELGLGNNVFVKNFRPAIIAMRVKATNQLSGTLDNVTIEAESVMPTDWNADWRDWPSLPLAPSDNPADAFRWLLQGPMNNSPVNNSKLDLEGLLTWRNRCVADNWRIGALLNDESTLQQQLNNVAFTGRAEFSNWTGKFGVVENIPQDFPVQVFSPKNSWDFSMQREFPEVVDGITYEFENKEIEYEKDEQDYLDPDLSTNELQGKFKGIELWGVTDPEIATRHARFNYFEEKLRRFGYSFTTDFEGLIPQRGQLVTINNDVIDVGLGSGYVTSVDGQNFTVDETINLEAGTEYRLRLRTFDADSIEFNATYNGDQQWTASEVVELKPEDLVLYGEPGFESVDCIVKSISYDEDYNATLTLVNAAQQLFDIDQDIIPQFESIITPKLADTPPLAPIVSVSSSNFSFSNQSILVSVNAAQQSGVVVDDFILQYKPESELSANEILEDEDLGEGDVSVTNGSAVVFGQDTNWIGNDPEITQTVDEGDFIVFSNDTSKVYTVDSVQADGELTLTEQFEGNTNTGILYRVVTPSLDTDDEWRDAGRSSSGTFNIPYDRALGSTIEFRARAVANQLFSPYSEIKALTLSLRPSDAVENFVIKELINTPRTPDAVFSTIEITVEEPDDQLYAFALIEFRVQGQPNWEVVGRIGSDFEDKQQQQVIANGLTYEFRARSVSIFGVESREGPISVIKTSNVTQPDVGDPDPADFIRVPNVTGLEIYDQGNDNVFTGRDVQFAWRKSTIEDWIEIGQEGKLGASSAKLDQYFRDYQVEIWANNKRVHKDWVEDALYTYTYEQNAEDFEREEGVTGAYRDFQVRVLERGRNNQISKKAAKLSVTNPPIQSLSGLQVEAGFNVIEIEYDLPSERDFAGVDVWVSDEAGIVESDPVRKTVSDNTIVLSGLEQGTDYFVRLRPFDVFGRTGSPLTAEFAVTTKSGIDLDGLSQWSYQIDPVDREFIINNMLDDSLVASKISAGTISAIGPITTESLFQAVPEGALSDPDQSIVRTGLGNLTVDGTTYMLWGIGSNGDLNFGIDETGSVFFKGEVAASSFTNENLTIDEMGNVVSSGTFRFGGDSDNFVEFDGTNMVFTGKISAASVEGSTITGSTIRTAVSGERMEITDADNRLRFYDSFGDVRVVLGTNEVQLEDGTSITVSATVDGDLFADALSASSISSVTDVGSSVGIGGSGFDYPFRVKTPSLNSSLLRFTSDVLGNSPVEIDMRQGGLTLNNRVLATGLNLDQQVFGVGSLVFAANMSSDDKTYGDLLNGTCLEFASAAGTGTGTLVDSDWMCLGFAPGTGTASEKEARTTLWICVGTAATTTTCSSGGGGVPRQ